MFSRRGTATLQLQDVCHRSRRWGTFCLRRTFLPGCAHRHFSLRASLRASALSFSPCLYLPFYYHPSTSAPATRSFHHWNFTYLHTPNALYRPAGWVGFWFRTRIVTPPAWVVRFLRFLYLRLPTRLRIRWSPLHLLHCRFHRIFATGLPPAALPHRGGISMPRLHRAVWLRFTRRYPAPFLILPPLAVACARTTAYACLTAVLRRFCAHNICRSVRPAPGFPTMRDAPAAMRRVILDTQLNMYNLVLTVARLTALDFSPLPRRFTGSHAFVIVCAHVLYLSLRHAPPCLLHYSSRDLDGSNAGLCCYRYAYHNKITMDFLSCFSPAWVLLLLPPCIGISPNQGLMDSPYSHPTCPYRTHTTMLGPALPFSSLTASLWVLGVLSLFSLPLSAMALCLVLLHSRSFSLYLSWAGPSGFTWVLLPRLPICLLVFYLPLYHSTFLSSL